MEIYQIYRTDTPLDYASAVLRVYVVFAGPALFKSANSPISADTLAARRLLCIYVPGDVGGRCWIDAHGVFMGKMSLLVSFVFKYSPRTPFYDL